MFDCFGVNEAFAASVMVRLPDAVQIRVAPIPAQAVLKIAAWRERKHTHPGRDAPDLLLFLRRYMDCGNLDRAASEHRDLFGADEFDYVQAGVRLLARDVAPLIAQPLELWMAVCNWYHIFAAPTANYCQPSSWKKRRSPALSSEISGKYDPTYCRVHHCPLRRRSSGEVNS